MNLHRFDATAEGFDPEESLCGKYIYVHAIIIAIN